MTRVSITMEEELKKEADAVLKEMGLDMPTIVRVFLKQMVREKRVPLSIELDTYDEKRRRQREGTDWLLAYASENKSTEADYKFNRDELYDRT